MKTNLKWSVILIFCLSVFSGCDFNDDDGIFNCEQGEGDIVTRTLDLPAFTGIDLDCSFDVTISQGEQQLVTVEGHENIIELLELDIQNNIWEIEFDKCVRNNDDDLKIDITLPEIDFIKISGSGKVFGQTDIDANDLELRISGSGDMDLALATKKVHGKISGSGKIILEGETDDFDYTTSGSGDWRTFDLEARRGDVKINGSGKTEVNVSESLDVTINGSGDVYYKGNPQINVSINGSGKLVNGN